MPNKKPAKKTVKKTTRRTTATRKLNDVEMFFIANNRNMTIEELVEKLSVRKKLVEEYVATLPPAPVVVKRDNFDRPEAGVVSMTSGQASVGDDIIRQGVNQEYLTKGKFKECLYIPDPTKPVT